MHLWIQWEKLPDFSAFAVNLQLMSGQESFSRLLNPDWSVQISGAPAVCKVIVAQKKIVNT